MVPSEVLVAASKLLTIVEAAGKPAGLVNVWCASGSTCWCVGLNQEHSAFELGMAFWELTWDVVRQSWAILPKNTDKWYHLTPSELPELIRKMGTTVINPTGGQNPHFPK